MKKFTGFISIMAALAVMVLTISPNQASGADFKKYAKIVDFAFVQPYAAIPIRDDVVIIDSRPMKRRYDKGHIPVAVSIPDSQFDKFAGKLPQDKSKLLIFYCGGLKCPLSHKSAFKAEAKGYTNVSVYAAGFPDWIKNGQLGSVSASYVKKALEKKTAVVVDVRPFKRRYAKGHVPGAISIPLSQFDKMTGKLPGDKANELIFYCGGYKCPLSPKAAVKAKALGYTKVKLFQGGYPAWKKAFGKGVSGPEPYAKTGAKSEIKAGPDGDTVTVASFKEILKNDPGSVHLIDVRDPNEFAKGALPGTVNIPTEEIEAKVNQLPTDKPIIFVCATGARSGEAYDIVKLVKEDMKVFFLDAEITYAKDGSYKIAAGE